MVPKSMRCLVSFGTCPQGRESDSAARSFGGSQPRGAYCMTSGTTAGTTAVGSPGECHVTTHRPVRGRLTDAGLRRSVHRIALWRSPFNTTQL